MRRRVPCLIIERVQPAETYRVSRRGYLRRGEGRPCYHTVSELSICAGSAERVHVQASGSMPYKLEFTHEAIRDLRRLRASDAARIVDECQRVLTVNPTLTSKARIKHLHGGVFPPYRLRIGEFRAFYDVREDDQVVVVYGVIDKAQAQDWLNQMQRQERPDENSDRG